MLKINRTGRGKTGPFSSSCNIDGLPASMRNASKDKYRRVSSNRRADTVQSVEGGDGGGELMI